MQSLSRRHFLAASGVGIAAAALPADPLSLPIGCQTYPVRDALGKDLNGTQVPVGKGVVDWTKLFAAAKKGGVKNSFVDLGMDALQPSYDYLHAMRS